MIIVDTNVIVFGVVQLRSFYAERLEKLVATGQLATTVMIRYEALVVWRDSKKAEERVVNFLNMATCRLFDRAALERALEIGRGLRREMIPSPDALIAGMALHHGDGILTTDLHFERVRRFGIKVEILPVPPSHGHAVKP